MLIQYTSHNEVFFLVYWGNFATQSYFFCWFLSSSVFLGRMPMAAPGMPHNYAFMLTEPRLLLRESFLCLRWTAVWGYKFLSSSFLTGLCLLLLMLPGAWCHLQVCVNFGSQLAPVASAQKSRGHYVPKWDTKLMQWKGTLLRESMTECFTRQPPCLFIGLSFWITFES